MKGLYYTINLLDSFHAHLSQDTILFPEFRHEIQIIISWFCKLTATNHKINYCTWL